MKTALSILGGIVAVVAVYVVMIGLTLGNIHVGGFLSAEQKKMETKVFEETTSFTRGMNAEFTDLYLSYEATGNLAVCQTIKHKFGTYYDVLEPLQQQQYNSINCVKANPHE